MGLGGIGLFVPLIPTTPFLILASTCFMKSSPRCRRWLLASRWFGPVLRDWDEGRGVRRSIKVLAVIMVGTVVAITWTREVPEWVPILTTLLATIGLLVVWRLPVAGGNPSSVPNHHFRTVLTARGDRSLDASHPAR